PLPRPAQEYPTTTVPSSTSRATARPGCGRTSRRDRRSPIRPWARPWTTKTRITVPWIATGTGRTTGRATIPAADRDQKQEKDYAGQEDPRAAPARAGTQTRPPETGRCGPAF